MEGQIVSDDIGVIYEDSGRIYLRRLTEKDVSQDYLDWFKDESVTQFLDSSNLTYTSVVEYIKTGEESRTHYMYGIFDKDTKRHIGNLKIGPIQWRHLISDLVCVIGARDFWGKGLAKEAIRLGNRIAFDVYGMRKVSGGIASDNIGSIKAYTGADWVIEAVMKGHHLINDQPQDRVVVSCFNPKYFSSDS